MRAWLAYPHQNLGAAAEAMDDPAAAIAAAARLAGLGDLSLPAFGPFALPPSDALAIAVEPGGERLAVTIEVFPVVAALARVAGIDRGQPGPSRRIHHRFGTADERDLERPRLDPGCERRAGAAGVAKPVAAEEGLAFVTLDERQGAVEPGTYRLRREDDELVLSSSGGEARSRAGELAEQRARDHDLAVLALRARTARCDEPVGDAADPRARGCACPTPRWRGRTARHAFDCRASAFSASSASIHSKDRWGRGASPRWKRRASASRRELAPALGEAAAAQQASLVLWVRPLDYLPVVSAIAAVLGALPIAPRDEVEHWRDLETVLESLGPVDGWR